MIRCSLAHDMIKFPSDVTLSMIINLNLYWFIGYQILFHFRAQNSRRGINNMFTPSGKEAASISFDPLY